MIVDVHQIIRCSRVDCFQLFEDLSDVFHLRHVTIVVFSPHVALTVEDVDPVMSERGRAYHHMSVCDAPLRWVYVCVALGKVKKKGAVFTSVNENSSKTISFSLELIELMLYSFLNFSHIFFDN